MERYRRRSVQGPDSVIVAIGVDVDHTFAHFVGQVLSNGVELTAINLRAVVQGDWRFELPPRAAAMVTMADSSIELDPDASFYCRLINLSSHAADEAMARRWHALFGGLGAWLNTVPGCVVNRPDSGAHNSSKPLHEAILSELGFRVPESVTSCCPDTLRSFIRAGSAISKPVSGVRADTMIATEAEFEAFDPASGPVHLQRQIVGADARIHVIGDRLIAQRISAGGVDYRREGRLNELRLFDPPTALRTLLIEASRTLGLHFAGWDFKIDADGAYWCLEANSMPGYSSYDEWCDGAISKALLQYLSLPHPENG